MLTKVPRLYHVSPDLLKQGALRTLPLATVLTQLGLVAHPKPGLVNWLPMGQLVLDKVLALVARHMDNAGAEKVSLLTLSHSLLWQQTGRWAGSELFRLHDGTGAEYCLAPTCEEEITALAKNSVRLYKQLPLTLYQVGKKFRDELRPRGGLLRGREFVMKDAYSFDTSVPGAMRSYENMVAAYHAVFAELRVPYVKAAALLGDIGGSMLHEWHYLHPLGEDHLMRCLGCGAALNVEKTASFPDPEASPATQVAVEYFLLADKCTLVCAYYPLDRVLLRELLTEELPDIDFSVENAIEDFLAADELLRRIVRVMDARLTPQLPFPDFPVPFGNRLFLTTLTDIPLVEAHAGELCGECNGVLETANAIEVAHTFVLGDKYSAALDFAVSVPRQGLGSTDRIPVQMGCYGIGVSRLVGAIAELCRDDNGLRWPAAIAMWQATVVCAGADADAAKVCEALAEHGIDYRLDDRADVRLGRKIKESNALGVPLLLIVGKAFPEVEVEVRAVSAAGPRDEKLVVHVDDIGRVLAQMIKEI